MQEKPSSACLLPTQIDISSASAQACFAPHLACAGTTFAVAGVGAAGGASLAAAGGVCPVAYSLVQDAQWKLQSRRGRRLPRMSANHNVEFKQNTQTRDLIALLAYEIAPG